MLTRDELIEILEEDCARSWTGDNAIQGLDIIRKYFSESDELICGSDHDIIYSVDVDELIEHGLTKEDAIKLSQLNWIIEYDCLACYL